MTNIIKWDRVSNYKSTNLEKKLIEQLFREYIDGNDSFEGLSKPELETIYEAFKFGLIISNVLFEE